MSPADRSYDAIGLMKQVGEHTAAACANAQEVLGNETPQSLLKGRRGKFENQYNEKKKNHVTNSQQRVRSTSAPDILVRFFSHLFLTLVFMEEITKITESNMIYHIYGRLLSLQK